MSAYRFCRTDDIGLLVDALNRCWLPHFPDAEPMTAAAFKWSIRTLQVWCSSCMVAFSGADPIGVLIGAKRSASTLIYKIAVHPDHQRQGHGRHLLASLASKLSILGPPRIVAEVPTTLAACSELFRTSGYAQEAVLSDYVSAQGGTHAVRREGFVIPVTIDDLAANDLLADTDRQVCWERSVETLIARKGEIAGLAVASDERIEAYVLYLHREVGDLRSGGGGRLEVEGRRSEVGDRTSSDGGGRSSDGGGEEVGPPQKREAEIVALRSFADDGGARVQLLLSQLRGRGTETLRFPKVHPGEASDECLKRLGFRSAGEYIQFAVRP